MERYFWGMRGVVNDRHTKLIYLVNGHKMNAQARDGFQGEVVLGLLNDIERVEVLRGPAGGFMVPSDCRNCQCGYKKTGNNAQVNTGFTIPRGLTLMSPFGSPSDNQKIFFLPVTENQKEPVFTNQKFTVTELALSRHTHPRRGPL